MKKNILSIFIVLLFIPIFASAKECGWFEISQKKDLAQNISWSYEYYLKNNKMYFDLTVTNVYEDLYIVDTSTNKKYAKKEFVIEKLSDNQKISFEIYSKDCKDVIATKDISLPAYNKYYSSDYCKGISEFSSCRKWQTLSTTIDESTLKKQTDAYRESLKEKPQEVITYATENTNFYVFVGLALAVLTLTLIFIIREKHEKDFI